MLDNRNTRKVQKVSFAAQGNTESPRMVTDIQLKKRLRESTLKLGMLPGRYARISSFTRGDSYILCHACQVITILAIIMSNHDFYDS